MEHCGEPRSFSSREMIHGLYILPNGMSTNRKWVSPAIPQSKGNPKHQSGVLLQIRQWPRSRVGADATDDLLPSAPIIRFTRHLKLDLESQLLVVTGQKRLGIVASKLSIGKIGDRDSREAFGGSRSSPAKLLLQRPAPYSNSLLRCFNFFLSPLTSHHQLSSS
jgi:hypothetical protein